MFSFFEARNKTKFAFNRYFAKKLVLCTNLFPNDFDFLPWFSFFPLLNLPFFFFFKNARPETVTNDDEEALDEETKRRDQMIKGAIEVLIREYSSELNAPSQESDSHPRKKKKEKKEDVRVTDFFLFLKNYFTKV